jgi:hypothetical protein
MSWYKSKTFWGAVLLFVPKIIEAAGVLIPPLIGGLIQAIGGVIGSMGIRGAILKAPTEASKVEQNQSSNTFV